MPVVEAVMVASGTVGQRTEADDRITRAMLDAVEKAQNEGVTDPVEIRARILAARDAALEN